MNSTEEFINGLKTFCQTSGTILLLPLVYHVYKGTDMIPNSALVSSTITGLCLITTSLVPTPPPVLHGQSQLEMISDTVGYLGKTLLVASIGFSLIKHYSNG
jgi:H+/gluconate symporter-like permease